MKAGLEKNLRQDEAKTRLELAKTRRELTKTRQEQARTRLELSRTRQEQIKTRAELAKTRAKRNKNQTRQVEKTLQRVVHREFETHQKVSAPSIIELPLNEFASHKAALERLTIRQREILQLIAESQNTKQIAGILKVSSKTVEYHRRKLMAALNVFDIPGLVRFALRAGLIPPDREIPKPVHQGVVSEVR